MVLGDEAWECDDILNIFELCSLLHSVVLLAWDDNRAREELIFCIVVCRPTCAYHFDFQK